MSCPKLWHSWRPAVDRYTLKKILSICASHNQCTSFCPSLRTNCSTYLAFRMNGIRFKSPYLKWLGVSSCTGGLLTPTPILPCHFVQQRCVWWGRAGTLTLVKWTDREGSACLVGNCHIIKNNFAFIPRRKTTAWKPQTSLF